MSLARQADHTAVQGGLTSSALAWSMCVSLAILLAIAAGGSTQAHSSAVTVLRLACATLMVLGLIRLWRQGVTLSIRLALSLILLMIGLAAFHLVPLPSTLHSMLPGRQFVTSTNELVGLAGVARPLTLSPSATWECILALLPPISLFIAALTIAGRMQWMPATAVLAGATASVLLGLAQRFGGADSGLYMYEISNFGTATGFFSNRNHFAALLYITIPLTWALSSTLYERTQLPGFAALAFGSVVTGVVLVGLAAAASRAGIILGMLALLLSAIMLWSSSSLSLRKSMTGLTIMGVLGGALIIGQFGMIGILRLAESDPLTEHRTTIAQITIGAAARYFPFGSGLGTYEAVYAMHEPPATMLGNYVNHAHNDWLELWLEGGLPAAALAVMFLVLFALQSWLIWRPSGPYSHQILPRAGTIGVFLLLLHSAVDYPLRMPALACIFAILLALAFAEPSRRRVRRVAQHRAPREMEEVGSPPPSIPARPPSFKVYPPRHSLRHPEP